MVVCGGEHAQSHELRTLPVVISVLFVVAVAARCTEVAGWPKLLAGEAGALDLAQAKGLGV